MSFHCANHLGNSQGIRHAQAIELHVSMMMRFRASVVEDLRLFVNLDYLTGTPFKIAAATAFGAVFGGLGGTLGWLMRGRTNIRTA
jgi:hypothetical protein